MGTKPFLPTITGNPPRWLLGLPSNLLLSSLVLAVYWTAVDDHMTALAFVTGAALAFYVPGVTVVDLAHGFFSSASSMERVAMTVIFSIAFVSMSAFVLDFTPLGITRTTLALSVTFIVFLAWTVHLAHRARNRRRGHGLVSPAFLVLTLLVAGGWTEGMHWVANTATQADQLLAGRPPAGYSVLTASCTIGTAGTDLEYSLADHNDPYHQYRLILHLDNQLVSASSVEAAPSHPAHVEYEVSAKSWHWAVAELKRDSLRGSAGTPLFTTLSPSVCTRTSRRLAEGTGMRTGRD